MRDCGRDLGRLIHAGQLVQPWAVVAQGPLDIMDHVTSALPFMVARTFVVHIPKSPLNRVRSGTIRREPSHGKAGVVSPPLLDGFGFMNTGVIHHDRETGALGRWGGPLQEMQAVTKERIGFAGAKAVT